MPPEIVDAGPPRGSPEWWVRRLSRRLDIRLGHIAEPGKGRRTPLTRWHDYYRGRLNLALASEKWRSEFATRFPVWSANFMETVVEKHRERLAVYGIRFGDAPGSDDDAWRWWQDNHLDAESLKLHREALVSGSGYVLVWPNDEGIPETSIESASEVVVETAPGKSWKRLAALKRFLDDEGRLAAELYLPNGIYKFRSAQRDQDFSSTRWMPFVRWEHHQPARETWPIENKIGVVPIVPFVHKPDLLNEGVSKIESVASNQDAINKYRVDAFVAAEFASFRQRWAIGIDVPVDPVTGEPIETFRAAVDRLWVVGPPSAEDYPDGRFPEVRFGEFEATPLAPFYESIAGELRMIGTNGPVPYHFLMPQSGQPPSGDSLRSAEAALTSAALDTQVDWGESYEELFRLNLLFRGDAKAAAPNRELIWRDPEVQSEGEHIDALLKMRAMGIPDVALWERIHGVTQQTIRRWKVMAAQQRIEGGSLAPATDLTLLAGGRANAPASARIAGDAEPAG